MGIDKHTLSQLGHLLRPLGARIANTVARAVVQLADDTTKLQLLQLGVLAGETVDNAEYHQPYGFSSTPLVGAEVVLVFPNGDRSHPLAIGASDRRYRPTGGEAGGVSMYHYKGAKITMLASGDIEINPGPGGEVFIRDSGGTAQRLVTKGDFDGHTHPAGTLVAPAGTAGGPVTGISGGAADAAGTQRLQSQ